MINCPNCNSQNNENNQFCGKCGAKLPDLKYCIKDHYQSYDDDFCIICGEKLLSKEEYAKIESELIGLMHKAKVFVDSKLFKEAWACYDEILKIKSDKNFDFKKKEWFYRDLGQFEKAIECCDKEIEMFPHDSYAYLYKGTYLNELGKFDEAIECFDKSILIDSNNHSPYLRKGESLLELGKFDDALYCFEKALKIKPDNSLNFLFVAQKLCHFLKFDEALVFCEKGLIYHPLDNELNFQKSIILFLTGDMDEANELISKYNLNAAKLFNAVAYFTNLMGDYYKAEMYCNKSIELDSQFYHSWITKGEIYFNFKRYDESLIYFKRGFDLNNENVDKIIMGLSENCRKFVKSNLF